MKKGAEIKYVITKEIVYRHSLVGWLESWGIEREDWDKFMEAGEKALDREDGDVDEIDADSMVTVMIYDEEHEEIYTKRMTIGEYLDRYTEEGCPWEGADDED